MRHFIIFSLLVFACTSCSSIRYVSAKKTETSEMSRIINTTARKFYYENHLDLDDSVIFYNNGIHKVRLDFSTMASLELEEARALLVDVVEEMLNKINSNQQVVSQLNKGKLHPSQIELYINFKSNYNHYVDLQMVGLVSLRNGIANFFASDGLDCQDGLWHKRSEYYWQSKMFTEYTRQGDALYKPHDEKEMKNLLQEERFIF